MTFTGVDGLEETLLQTYIARLKFGCDQLSRFYDSNIDAETPLDKIRISDLAWYLGRIKSCIGRIETVEECKANMLNQWMKNENRYLLSFEKSDVDGFYDALILSKNLMRSMNEFLIEIRLG